MENKKRTWQDNLNLLIDFLNTHNGEYPTQHEKYKDISIGNWVTQQRIIHNKGKLQEDKSIRYGNNSLTEEKINQLNAINFKWHGCQYQWIDYYDSLIKYLKEYNHYPEPNEIYNNLNLNKWVNEQRRIYRQGKKRDDGTIVTDKNYVLTKERIEMLENIHFLWEDDSATWREKYNLLIEYLVVHNGEYPKDKEAYKKVNIGRWVTRQRFNYHQGIMKQERIDLLNKIQFKWSAIDESQIWNEHYNQLVEYLTLYKKFPKDDEFYNGINLGKWTSQQRGIYHSGIQKKDGKIVNLGGNILTKERIDKLNNIGFIWNKFENNWYTTYDTLVEYLSIPGHSIYDLPTNYKNMNLKSWVNYQRQVFLGTKKCCLSEEKIKLLDAIKIDWVKSINYFNQKELTKVEEIEGLKRLLESKLNRLNELKRYEFNTKKDVDSVNQDLLDSFYKKVKKRKD